MSCSLIRIINFNGADCLKVFNLKIMKLKFSTFTVLIFFGSLGIIGLSIIPLLDIQLMPSQEKTTINVNYRWKNASAKLVEEEVTSKLEGFFNTIKGVKDIKSTSSKGRGRISLSFKAYKNKDALRFEVATLIRQSYDELPEGVSYPEISPNFNQVIDETKKSILSYSINGNQSSFYIKKYAEKKILPQISETKGVNQVNVVGGTQYEWVIAYNPNQIAQLNINSTDISTAINTHFQKKQIGIGNTSYEKRIKSEEKSIAIVFNSDSFTKLSNIPIKKVGNRIIYLDDIAKISFKEAEVESYYRTNGLNSINIVIYPEKEINTINLAKKVRLVIDEFKSDVFIDGYTIKLTRDSTEFLSDEIKKIEYRTMYSLLILLILIIGLYRSLKYTFVLLSSIIINLLIAIIFYFLLDIKLQLYSFAGITVSFGIIIDNSIIMIDHYKRKRDKKVFLAILAATMTTIAALLIILFLKEEEQVNLRDFALIITSNISVSLLVSLYFIPAILQKTDFRNTKRILSVKAKKRIIKFTNAYIKLIFFLQKKPLKLGLVLLLILGFGIPINLFPEQLEGESTYVKAYNKTLGNEYYHKEIRPSLEKIIGGTLRLFTEDVFENSYSSDPEKTVLRVSAEMPEGSSVEQLNNLIQRMENIISQYDEVSLFETRITDPQSSNISIYFKEEFENFPHELKDILEFKAVSLGGATWRISGIGQGFSNSLRESAKNQKITLQGYNYDQLYSYALTLKNQLIENSKSRVKEIEITNGGRYSKSLNEFFLYFDQEKIAEVGLNQNEVYGFFKNQVYSEKITSIEYDNELINVRLIANNYNDFNLWDLKHTPLLVKNQEYKLNQLTNIDKRKTGNVISKKNQQYNLTVAYDFVGNHQLANIFRKNNIKEFKDKLPLGFLIGKSGQGKWNKEEKSQYYSLIIIAVLIFFICSILLESFKQPLVIISIIPLSFTGVFLIFHLFKYNFDQGGYASFILLSGISVNSCLYIINDFNNLKIQFPNRDVVSLFFKAFNYKIIPILLTIISTVAGLIPFLWDGQKEVFWFSFALGSIGGLIFSIIGIYIYIPLFVLNKKHLFLEQKSPKVFGS